MITHTLSNIPIKVEAIDNELLQSSSYIVTRGETLIIIDCGDYDKIVSIIGKDRKPNAILLTHCHQDHVYGLPHFLTQYPSTPVYCSQSTLEGLKNEEHNLSYIIPEYPFDFTQEDQVVVIKEGTIEIRNLQIEVISTPGHSDDCMTYIIDDNIFSGDSYIPFAKVFTKWPRSNKTKAMESEKRIISLINDRHLKVYSGHWNKSII